MRGFLLHDCLVGGCENSLSNLLHNTLCSEHWAYHELYLAYTL